MWKYVYMTAMITSRSSVTQLIDPRDVLCIHCGSTNNIVDSEEMIYLYCNDCSKKDRVYKRGAAKK